MIPENLDPIAVFDELNRLGWSDSKIERACGLAQACISHLRAGWIRSMRYENAARVLNLLERERAKRLCAA